MRTWIWPVATILEACCLVPGHHRGTTKCPDPNLCNWVLSPRLVLAVPGVDGSLWATTITFNCKAPIHATRVTAQPPHLAQRKAEDAAASNQTCKSGAIPAYFHRFARGAPHTMCANKSPQHPIHYFRLHRFLLLHFTFCSVFCRDSQTIPRPGLVWTCILYPDTMAK